MDTRKHFIEVGKFETQFNLKVYLFVCPVLIIGIVIFCWTKKKKEESWWTVLNRQRLGSLPFTAFHAILFLLFMLLVQVILYVISSKNDSVAFWQGVL